MLAGSRWRDLGLVFATGIGTPFGPRRVTRHFQTVLTKAKLPGKRLHDLRHTAATLLHSI